VRRSSNIFSAHRSFSEIDAGSNDLALQQDVHAKAVDVWALGECKTRNGTPTVLTPNTSSGVTLYCMIRGQLPFESTNPLELYDAIKTAP
jgi:serine/threonine protein kinase